jgi:hypothetical protein
VGEGFRDGTGSYGFLVAEPLSGVWLSDVPLDENEGARGDTVLAVKLTLARAKKYEVLEPGKGFREYLVPASVLNRRAKVRVLPPAEFDRLECRLARRSATLIRRKIRDGVWPPTLL